jgi:hypothetical protein
MNKPKEVREVELHPDAWERFERAAGVVAKSPPQHRAAKEKSLKDKAKKVAKKSRRTAK